MTFIPKPKLHHPDLQKNALGLTRRDYEGPVSTLCAGCGHDSISAAIVKACFELDIEPHRVAKMSGIGCSSKTPTYFLGASHGFNSVHGRMPSVATGIGQFAHAMRRGVNMVYIVENNGVYGLTKGQFSATSDKGAKSKRGVVNSDEAIDLVGMALQLGATFVARSFSGDKGQLVPILKAGLAHKGFALVDVISPCVTFNDHEGSTKSYRYTRAHQTAIAETDFVPHRPEITADYPEGAATSVTMHDGSVVRFTKLPPGYDPTDRGAVTSYLLEHQRSGVIPTGLLYMDERGTEMHDGAKTAAMPLTALPYERLCPGSDVLEKLQASYR